MGKGGSLRVKLYSCHHDRPIFPASGDLFMPIWTGGEEDPAGRWLTDAVAAAGMVP
jgi:hypothetical protein